MKTLNKGQQKSVIQKVLGKKPRKDTQFSDREMVDGIIAWAQDKDWFDTSFVDDIDYRLNKYCTYPSKKQVESLRNIIKKCKIDLAEYL